LPVEPAVEIETETETEIGNVVEKTVPKKDLQMRVELILLLVS
jgi:hypothetical protein